MTPNEQNQACLGYAMAKKRTFRGKRKNEFRFRFQDEENIKNKNLLILNESQKVFL